MCGGETWVLREEMPDPPEVWAAAEEADAFKADVKVVGYRRARFLFLGLDTARAEIAAVMRGPIERQGHAIDLHEFAGLVEAGASPEQAYEILL